MCDILTKKYGRAPVLNMPGDEEPAAPAPGERQTCFVFCAQHRFLHSSRMHTHTHTTSIAELLVHSHTPMESYNHAPIVHKRNRYSSSHVCPLTILISHPRIYSLKYTYPMHMLKHQACSKTTMTMMTMMTTMMMITMRIMTTPNRLRHYSAVMMMTTTMMTVVYLVNSNAKYKESSSDSFSEDASSLKETLEFSCDLSGVSEMLHSKFLLCINVTHPL